MCNLSAIWECTFVHTISSIQGLGKAINSQFCQSNFNFHTLLQLMPNVIRGKKRRKNDLLHCSFIDWKNV